MNGVNGTIYSNGGPPSSNPVRPPTVDEALQYSPLSSIVPFSPDIIPWPSVDPQSSSDILSSPEERRSSRRALDFLNAEAAGSHSTSDRLQATLQKLQDLLHADDLTQFNFKRPPAATQPQRQQRHSNGTSARFSPLQLSRFSRMALEATNVSYRYPTPESPNTKPLFDRRPSLTVPQRASPRPSTPAPNSVQARNQTAHNRNANIGVGTTEAHLQTKAHTIPAVIILPLPPSSQREEYEEFPELDAKLAAGESSVSKKRKHESLDAENEPIAITVNQKAKADAALVNLKSQLAEIFEAEDQLQPDTSGVVSADAARYFISGINGEQGPSVLAPSIQLKLDSAVQQVVILSRFSDVSVVQLGRIQKLCENAVASVETLGLSVGDSASESDVDEWARRLELAENGLQAAKTLLRIMTAGREEKQLYSEDLLQTILNALKHVVDMCLIPVVETRNSDVDADNFKSFSTQKKPLTSLLQTSGRVLRLLGELLVKVDVAESAVTSVEFMCTRLIFVENAHSEKDSAFGIKRFEVTRRIAMDVLAKIFARYSDQRTFIFDEILTSLEKLPVTRQSARQFKMVDGKPIQLVSALLMRLVQTSATRSIHDRRKKITGAIPNNNDHEEDDSGFETDRSSPKKRPQTLDLTNSHAQEPEAIMEELAGLCRPLSDNAQREAQYLIKYLVQRALTATKTGDQPYRNLLDIFTEDFVSVLGSTGWPAAELLLRTLLSNMVGITENEKSTAPAKNMALDLMGLMGSGICDLQLYVRHASRSIDTSQSELSSKLAQVSEDVLDGKLNLIDLLEFEGPYRIVIEYLQARGLSDPQPQSSQGYYLTQWTKSACTADEGAEDGDEHDLPMSLALQLRNMILDPSWLENEHNFETVSTVQARLSAALIALSMPFCKAFKRIFSILLTAMNSDQATVKSRSLKSVVQLLEKDSSILDRDFYVVNHILRCITDSSPLVRDSALNLLSKCLSLKPALEGEVYDRVIARTVDAAIGVRKRAMKILKDIYLRNEKKDVKSDIADALLQRIKDADESVSDLARQTFEEIWISPFYGMLLGRDDAVQSKLSLQRQVSLIIRTVQRGENVLIVLDTLLQGLLSNDSKNMVANFRVCKAMVADMFDGLVDNDERPDKPSQQHILQTLTVFAKANPKLFTGEQLELLEPYIKNLANTDDLLIYRSVIVIFRHVLPTSSSFEHAFLNTVQNTLLSSVSKLGKMELTEVAPCLWTIDSVLKNTDRLIRLTVSVINGIYTSKDANLTDESQKAMLGRLKRYMMIAGHFGKACDFESHAQSFREKLLWWKGTSVAGLIVDMLCPFTRQKQPGVIRETAFESIGMICQAWPKQFLRSDVGTAFELVFVNGDTKLEWIVLSVFRGFFAQEEQRSGTGAEVQIGEGAGHGSDRLGKSMMATDNDGASTAIAQRYLQHVLRIALATTDDLALTATQVIASINRQGLVHPKECGPALVALETSPNPNIANIAFQEHRALHGKHESMFEKEYMKAVHEAFMYQQNVLHDTSGATGPPFASKLRSLYEVLKTGNSKTRKKFLANLCSRINFELPKLDTSGDPPKTLAFARFCVENLAFFEYARADEILHLLSCMEKLVTGTGAAVAHAIETDVLKVQLELDQSSQPAPAPDVQITDAIDGQRLRHLTIASVILTLIWETRTFLRRLYNLQKQREGKAKPTVKDLNKAPTRTQGVTGDHYMRKISEITASLSAPDAMLTQCRAFVELLSVDNELKIASDDEDADIERAAVRYQTPDADDAASVTLPPSGGSRGRKRKGSLSASNTPKKAKKRGPRRPRKERKSGSSEDAEEGGAWN